MSAVAERHGAEDGRDVRRSGYAPATSHDGTPDPHRDPAGDHTQGDPYGYEPGWESGGWYAEPDSRGIEYVEPEPPSGAVVAQPVAMPRSRLREDFGAHLETHYPRLVAQLYAITLHPGDAHDAVQDAYSRAWRRWADLRADHGDQDLVGWVRRVAIRTSMRGWRPGLTRAGLRRPKLPDFDALEPQTAALLQALATLPVAVRRAVVLHHMAGLDVAEIARLERVRQPVLADRLRRGRDAVQDGLDEMAGRMVDAIGVLGADADDGAGDAGWTGGRHGLRGEQA